MPGGGGPAHSPLRDPHAVCGPPRLGAPSPREARVSMETWDLRLRPPGFGEPVVVSLAGRNGRAEARAVRFQRVGGLRLGAPSPREARVSMETWDLRLRPPVLRSRSWCESQRWVLVNSSHCWTAGRCQMVWA
jgi:hypothetical protein